MGQPRVVAMMAACAGSTCMGTKQDLWKLMVRPVAFAKSSRTFFRREMEATSPRQRIRVSSAYWRTGQGLEGSSGCERPSERKACRMSWGRTSTARMRR